jgi:hypothetical protein
MDIAIACGDIFKKQFPAIAQALEELNEEPQQSPQVAQVEEKAPEQSRRQKFKSWFMRHVFDL